MKVTYDAKVDALYVNFIERKAQVATHRLTEDVALDYAPDGKIAGIELLSASRHGLGKGRRKRIRIENLEVVR